MRYRLRVRIVFFGSGEFGLPTLGSLAREHELLAFVTQPDRPAGRGRESAPTPVAAWAGEHAPSVPVLKPESVNDPRVVEQIRAIPADAWVVIAFGQKLSPALLAGRFAVNLHGSLLPRWRGAAPINHAILAGDAEAGVTVITLADRMDAGLMLGQASAPVGPAETAGELHDRLAALGPALVLRVLGDQSALPGFGSPAFEPRGARQDETLATRAPKLSRADAWVDFHSSSEVCRRRINALAPWPGVAVRFRGTPLRLLRAEAADRPPEQSCSAPGTIVAPERGLVACAGGSLLRIIEVQPPGGRAMEWKAFANGRRVAVGETLHGGASSAS
jgi:methionyl-tRNA formyltransferase